MIMATCRIRPNRHIALLNQQDVRGVIRLWQRRNSANVPLYMQVRLSGFKVDRDSDADCDNQTTQISPNSNENQTSVDNKLDNRKGSMQKFGMHVHESGDMSRDCQSTGHHYNPFMVSHGGPNDIIKHVGDLGNINCDQNGVVEENLVYNHLSLLGEHSIMNRAIVVCWTIMSQTVWLMGIIWLSLLSLLCRSETSRMIMDGHIIRILSPRWLAILANELRAAWSERWWTPTISVTLMLDHTPTGPLGSSRITHPHVSTLIITEFISSNKVLYMEIT